MPEVWNTICSRRAEKTKTAALRQALLEKTRCANRRNRRGFPPLEKGAKPLLGRRFEERTAEVVFRSPDAKRFSRRAAQANPAGLAAALFKKRFESVRLFIFLKICAHGEAPLASYGWFYSGQTARCGRRTPSPLWGHTAGHRLVRTPSGHTARTVDVPVNGRSCQRFCRFRQNAPSMLLERALDACLHLVFGTILSRPGSSPVRARRS